MHRARSVDLILLLGFLCAPRKGAVALLSSKHRTPFGARQRLFQHHHRSHGSFGDTDVRHTYRRLDGRHSHSPRLRATSGESYPDESVREGEGIDLSLDRRLYKVRLPRQVGIGWKTDLSFRWVSVRDMDPTGAASLSGLIRVDDQLCELTPVIAGSVDDQQGERPKPVNLLGAPFDEVMQAFAELDGSVKDVDLVFFRGTQNELKAACSGVESEPQTITVTVVQDRGGNDEKIRTLTAPAGVNVRELLVANGINVYQSVTRWTNCKGKQLCGTCIVNVSDGSLSTNRKSMDEASTLRENPDSYRLSCVTFAYGDVTVETFPPINAAQWTR